MAWRGRRERRERRGVEGMKGVEGVKGVKGGSGHARPGRLRWFALVIGVDPLRKLPPCVEDLMC